MVRKLRNAFFNFVIFARSKREIYLTLMRRGNEEGRRSCRGTSWIDYDVTREIRRSLEEICISCVFMVKLARNFISRVCFSRVDVEELVSRKINL